MHDEREPIPYLMARLLPGLRSTLALPPSIEPRDVVQEALFRLDSAAPGGDAQRLDRALRQRRAQRHVFGLVDHTIREILADGALPRPFRSRLRRALESVIDELPPRYRNLLRLRYGLDVTTEELSLRLGTRKASLHKPTSNGLALLARGLLARGLEAADRADGGGIRSIQPSPTD